VWDLKNKMVEREREGKGKGLEGGEERRDVGEYGRNSKDGSREG